MNMLLIPLIVAVVLLIAAASFGAWAFSSRSDYKNHSDAKAAVAAAAAVKAAQQSDAQRYAEEAKNPLKRFVGPSQFGSVAVMYPKTWSGYVITNQSTPLSAYFQPDVVPDVQAQDGAYALRVQVVSQTYANQLQSYSSLVSNKKVTLTPYSFPKVPGVVGSRIDGQISINNQGTIIVVPLRNLSLVVSTESQTFEPDFNNTILPNFTFAP
ncbi:MAG TPA: hypothetical protein VLF71_04225 [Candidatus Saccharimonadales bacterium]|nr:hypothetical protein [Candidatus Saccharimonadales bacterium]